MNPGSILPSGTFWAWHQTRGFGFSGFGTPRLASEGYPWLGPPGSCPFTVSFLGKGSPTKIDYKQKGTLVLWSSLLEDLFLFPKPAKDLMRQFVFPLWFCQCTLGGSGPAVSDGRFESVRNTTDRTGSCLPQIKKPRATPLARCCWPPWMRTREAS